MDSPDYDPSAPLDKPRSLGGASSVSPSDASTEPEAGPKRLLQSSPQQPIIQSSANLPTAPTANEFYRSHWVPVVVIAFIGSVLLGYDIIALIPVIIVGIEAWRRWLCRLPPFDFSASGSAPAVETLGGPSAPQVARTLRPASAANPPSPVATSTPLEGGSSAHLYNKAPTGVSSLSQRPAEWWMARTGIAFLILGVLFLLSDVVHQGWFTPELRCVLAAATGVAVFCWGLRQSDARPSSISIKEVLLGGGLAIGATTLWAASAWYALLSPALALSGITLLALLGVGLAWSRSLPTLASISLLGAYAAPGLLMDPDAFQVSVSLLHPYSPPVLLALGWVLVLSVLAAGMYLRRGWPSALWIGCAMSVLVLAQVFDIIVAPATTAMGQLNMLPHERTNLKLALSATIWVVAMIGIIVPIIWAWRHRKSEPFRDPVLHFSPDSYIPIPVALLPLFVLPPLGVIFALSNLHDLWHVTNQHIGDVCYALALAAAGLAIIFRARLNWAARPAIYGWIAIWATVASVLALPDGFAGTAVIGVHAVALWALSIRTRHNRTSVIAMSISILAALSCAQAPMSPLFSSHINGLSLQTLTPHQTLDWTVLWHIVVSAVLSLLVLATALWQARTLGYLTPSTLQAPFRKPPGAPNPASTPSRLRSQECIPILLANAVLAAVVSLWFLPARAVSPSWQPLVTVAWALASGALLMAADFLQRRPADPSPVDVLAGLPQGPNAPIWEIKTQSTWQVLRLTSLAGLATVAAKLVLWDLGAAATQWRIVAFLGCGALFLLLSARMARSRRP